MQKRQNQRCRQKSRWLQKPIPVIIEAMEPDKAGWTEAGPFGFAGDQFGTDERFIVWRINDDYAVTGFPLKDKDSVPANLAYLDSRKIAGLRNLSSDINLAARNALAAMIASIAVDMRIGQLVDVPNVGVTAARLNGSRGADY